MPKSKYATAVSVAVEKHAIGSTRETWLLHSLSRRERRKPSSLKTEHL
jgi:hypothetical protein